MLDLVLAKQVFNHVGGKLAALMSDQLSRVHKFVKYILP